VILKIGDWNRVPPRKSDTHLGHFMNEKDGVDCTGHPDFESLAWMVQAPLPMTFLRVLVFFSPCVLVSVHHGLGCVVSAFRTFIELLFRMDAIVVRSGTEDLYDRLFAGQPLQCDLPGQARRLLVERIFPSFLDTLSHRFTHFDATKGTGFGVVTFRLIFGNKARAKKGSQDLRRFLFFV